MIKQLNAFEIKREISRLVKALENSTILIDTAEFKTLDRQDDKQNIVKILMKEFCLCDEERLPVIKVLLLRYSNENELLNELETIIHNPTNENTLKLHAIELIAAFKPDWHEEGYDEYLEYDEELVQKETQELLQNSEENTEIQLDFLDFFSSIPPKDQLMLLESLEEDQKGGDLANILVPVFLSFPNSEIGQTALKMLSSTKSAYAYEALSQISHILGDKPGFKKCLSELKLSGAAKNSSSNIEYKNAEFYIIPPDGEGNFSLLYKKQNQDKSIKLIGIVIDDYTGIRECLGFSAISDFEASFLIEKLTDSDFKTPIEPELFKQFIVEAEALNYKKAAPPYEYNCWKKTFLNITPANINIENILNKQFANTQTNLTDLKTVFDSDYTVPWFYKHDFGDETEKFFSDLDKINIEEINLDEFISENIEYVIYKQEQENWKKRLDLTALCKLKEGENTAAQTLYNISRDEKLTSELYMFILKQSIFQYFLNMLTNKSYLKYSEAEVNKNLAYLENLWGFYV